MLPRLVFILTSSALVLALAGGVAWRLAERGGERRQKRERGPAPVRVAEIARGPIEQRRVFTGTLEASDRFTVAAQRSGRLKSLAVDLADPVERGQVVARLDDGEARQDLLQAEAQRTVAQAQRTEARSNQEIAQRAEVRLETLHRQGVASDTQLDTARAQRLAADATLAVAEAGVTRAQAGVRTAKIRLNQTEARAVWTLNEHETEGPRVVAERFVSAGDSVSANAPLFSVVDLDPITAVIFVTERDYGRIRPGQPITLDVDAWPGREFTGRVARVSPVFDTASRQARVEVAVPNPDAALKPGMFARVGVVLDRIDDALTVPADALTRRDGRPTVFVLNGDGSSVRQHAVEPGLTARGRVQLLGENLRGRVVTLGQQLLGDGSEVSVVQDPAAADAAADSPDAPSTLGAAAP